jgi:hypothetical protein
VVSGIENLSRVVGRIRDREAHPRLAGWDLVTLAVERVESVPGTADLLTPPADGPLTVAVRRELLGDAPAGSHLSARVRVTPRGLMAEPHPSDGDFSVRPPRLT